MFEDDDVLNSPLFGVGEPLLLSFQGRVERLLVPHSGLYFIKATGGGGGCAQDLAPLSGKTPPRTPTPVSAQKAARSRLTFRSVAKSMVKANRKSPSPDAEGLARGQDEKIGDRGAVAAGRGACLSGHVHLDEGTLLWVVRRTCSSIPKSKCFHSSL